MWKCAIACGESIAVDLEIVAGHNLFATLELLLRKSGDGRRVRTFGLGPASVAGVLVRLGSLYTLCFRPSHA